jgi:uncharacterized protein (TIGR00730 family)
MKRVCVFCGSHMGNRPEYVEAARQLGRLLVSRKIDLVYGGANIGLMGEIANTVLHEDGKVIGVIPKSLVKKEIAHTGLSDLRIVNSMPERKALMVDLSDGFIALPGGVGTIEEFFEVLTWALLGMHQKPCGLLNVCQYYRSLIEFINTAFSHQFIKDKHRSMMLVDESPEGLLKKLETYRAPRVDKWLNRKST